MSNRIIDLRPRKERPRNRQHRRAPLIMVLLLVALSITLAGIFPFRQLIAQQRQVSHTEEKLATLQAENQALADQVAALKTDPEIERLAREEYGLVFEGETPYTVTLPEEELVSQPAAAEEAPPDNRSLLQQVWDWMTGRDLYPDE